MSTKRVKRFPAQLSKLKARWMKGVSGAVGAIPQSPIQLRGLGTSQRPQRKLCNQLYGFLRAR